MRLERSGICALCGEPYGHYGNNPEPLLPYEKRVCDDCNVTRVIPARLRQLRSRIKNS